MNSEKRTEAREEKESGEEKMNEERRGKAKRFEGDGEKVNLREPK